MRGSHPRLRPALAAKASAVSRASESPEFVLAPGAANSTSDSAVESAGSVNDTASTNSSAGEDEADEDAGEDEGEGEGEDADEDDDGDDAGATNTTNVSIAANATEAPEVVETAVAPAPAPEPAAEAEEVEEKRPAACTGPAGNPCSLPLPPIAFSAEAHALSAVDEGQFAGYVRSSAAVFALLALVGGAS